jgi:hypothetical protein
MGRTAFDVALVAASAVGDASRKIEPVAITETQVIDYLKRNPVTNAPFAQALLGAANTFYQK